MTKYERALPEHLKERYLSFLDDPQITSVRNEMALLDTRINELIATVDSDVGSATWDALSKLWARFMLAAQSGDVAAQTDMVVQVNDLINKRSKQNSVWDDVERLSLSRTKLADFEQKRITQNNQMLTVEQAMALIGALITSIKDIVYLYADETTAEHIIIDTSAAYTKFIGGNEEDS